MLLSESERDRKIDDFLARKFRQFDIEDNMPSVREVRSFGGLHSK